MGNGTSIRNFDCLTAGSKGMSRDIGALLPNDNPLTRDVGALTGDIEILTSDGGGLTFNIGALTFDIGALIFDIGGLTFDVFGGKFSCRTLKINHLREKALKRPFLPIIHLPTPICDLSVRF